MSTQAIGSPTIEMQAGEQAVSAARPAAPGPDRTDPGRHLGCRRRGPSKHRARAELLARLRRPRWQPPPHRASPQARAAREPPVRRGDRTGGVAKRRRPGRPARADPAGVGLRPQLPEQRRSQRPDTADARHRLLAGRREPARPGRIDRRRSALPGPADEGVRRQHDRGARRLQRRSRRGQAVRRRAAIRRNPELRHQGHGLRRKLPPGTRR